MTPVWRFQERVLEQLEEQTKLLRELLEVQHKSLVVLQQIAKEVKPTYQVVVVQETDMADGVVVGQQAVFAAQMNQNGNPISLPAGSSWAWSTSDPAAQVALDPSDTTGGTIDVLLVAGDTTTSLTVTAQANDPTGTLQSGSITVPVTPGTTNVFTVSVTQTK